MNHAPWQLPWRGEWVPHALLDILRGCNINCRACYNSSTALAKSMDEVRADFDVLRRHRRLDSLSIVGGEPTLHPGLCEIVRLIKSAGVSVELFTNGLSLDGPRLAALKSAGVDLLFLHIDAHQDRPDLPSPTTAAMDALRTAKSAAVAAAGMEVGLAITAYGDATEEIDAAVKFVLNSPHADYLLVTFGRDMQSLGPLRGNLQTGIRGYATLRPRPEIVNHPSIQRRMLQRFGLRPFAYVGSNVHSTEPRWLSYLIATVMRDGQPPARANLRSSLAERLFVGLHRLTHGRYPFYVKHSPSRFRMHMLVNAIMGGAGVAGLAMLIRSLEPQADLRAKRLLFQCPAELDSRGSLIHCRDCPDATVRHGSLVPVCVSDQVVG